MRRTRQAVRVLAAGWIAVWTVAAAGAPGPVGEGGRAQPQTAQEVSHGIAALRGGDIIGAVRRWTAGGTLENSATLDAVKDDLQAFRKDLGQLGDVHLLGTVPLGPSGRIDYLALDYNRGPVYARFQLYYRLNRWSVIALAFSTDPNAVLPERMLDGN